MVLGSRAVVNADSHSKENRDVRAAAINRPQMIKLGRTVLVQVFVPRSSGGTVQRLQRCLSVIICQSFLGT